MKPDTKDIGQYYYAKWLGGKLLILLVLLLQFYLAKHYDEPYPCIILPAFAYPYPESQPITVYKYRVLQVGTEDTSQIAKAQLFPHCPPGHLDFFINQLMALPEKEQKDAKEKCWKQAQQSGLIELSTRLILRLEGEQYVLGKDGAITVDSRIWKEIVCTQAVADDQ